MRHLGVEPQGWEHGAAQRGRPGAAAPSLPTVGAAGAAGAAAEAGAEAEAGAGAAEAEAKATVAVGDKQRWPRAGEPLLLTPGKG